MWLRWSGIRVAGLSGACDYSVEVPHWSHCSWFDVCWSFGVVGLEWYSSDEALAHWELLGQKKCLLGVYPRSGPPPIYQACEMCMNELHSPIMDS